MGQCGIVGCSGLKPISNSTVEATNHSLSNSPIAIISVDIMENLAGGAEGRQQCLKTTWDRVVVYGQIRVATRGEAMIIRREGSFVGGVISYARSFIIF